MMKQILITGKNSYIGNSLEQWLEKTPGKYRVEKVSLRGEGWEALDFSGYDTLIHMAGIAHISSDPAMEEAYYRVNRDLTIKVARKAKAEGVKQFIFMSSIIVYTGCYDEQGVITKDTVPDPRGFYGKSKIQAEEGLEDLRSKQFKIAVLRPPMVYGRNGKGNYRKLSRFARLTPIFPNVENQRSMLHIDNLCEFMKQLIDCEARGLYFPQNKEYVKTGELVKAIRKAHGKNTYLVKLFNPMVKRMARKGIMNKVFGNLVYEKSMSEYEEFDYRVRSFKESIELTERGSV